jgi:predicted lipoprotein with Yx(FWY)xxD motif
MPRLLSAAARHPGRSVAALLAGVAGVAVVLAGMAFAKSFTLKVTNNVHVTNAPTSQFAVKPVNTHEAVGVGPSGFPVYTFQGETTHHIICKKTSSASTNCWGFWPPVTVSSPGSATKASGIKGKIGTFKNHGLNQVTLNGQPLYYFVPDIMSHNKHQATGDEIKTFGSIWHIVKASGSSSAATSTPMTSTPTTSSTMTQTNPYPPGWG